MPVPRAPWRQSFLAAKAAMRPEADVSFATIFHNKAGNSYHPRVRTCVLRGFFAELDLPQIDIDWILRDAEARHDPAHEVAVRTQDLGLNPRIFESDLLAFTTDERMGKVAEITENNNVELLMWAAESKLQWRISGKASVIGGNPDDEREGNAREEIMHWLRDRVANGDPDAPKSHPRAEKTWTFDREVLAHFSNMSPVMRGCFSNPPPNKSTSTSKPNDTLKQAQNIEDLHHAPSRSNFRVVVVRPEVVECMNLAPPPESKRHVWSLRGGRDNAHWEEDERWP